MNLLPRHKKEFTDKGYWNSFFKSRGSKEFEWYGEYPELCGYLHKYIKPKDNILVVGCGNSKLSADMYDVGYRQITNIDISTIVINQMKNSNSKDRPEMSFQQMDVLNMKFDESLFSVVLDKGTLDALVSDDAEEDLCRGRTLFEQVNKVLKFGGRYIVISLLQQHILNLLLSYFTEAGWMIRICRCFDVENKAITEDHNAGMPVFFIVCTKFKKLDKFVPILEVSVTGEDKVERLKNIEEMLDTIKSVQESALVCSGISKTNLSEEMCLDLCENNKVKYTIYVVDDQSKKNINKFAVFIVQLGRETEWMYSTHTGRCNLLKKCGYDRLAIVTLNNNHEYGDLSQIQDELRASMLQLAPRHRHKNNKQIPFITDMEKVDSRVIVEQGNSQYSGHFYIEEVTINDEVYRRLMFASNRSAIQSEVRLRTVKRKNKVMQVVDKDYMSHGYHSYMLLGAALCDGNTALVLGVGGGNLPTHMKRLFPTYTLTAVDIDPDIVNIAKRWFDLQDKDMNVVVSDGIEFVSNAADGCYDVILLDINSKELGVAMTFPPESFTQDEFLQQVTRVLSGSGMLVINVVCRLPELNSKLVDRLRKHFTTVCFFQLDQDINQIVYCSKTSTINNKLIQDHAGSFNNNVQKIMKMSEPVIDVGHLLENLNIVGP